MHPLRLGSLPSGRAAFPLLVSCAVMLGTGCSSGPEFRRPLAPLFSGTTAQPLPDSLPEHPREGEVAQRFLAGLPVDQRWWNGFGSPALDALVEHAVLANPDLEAAQAALRVAQETALAQQGSLLPSIQASYAPSRQKTPVGTLSPTLNSGDAVFNLHTAQVSVAYVPDVFGSVHRQIEQLSALAEVQQRQLEATYLTLVANVVAGAVNAAGLQAQIDATRALIRLQTEQRDLLARQRDLGAIAEGDVIAQDAALAQLQATLPPLRKQLELQRHVLSALSGQSAGQEAPPDFSLADFTLPAQLPMVVPAQLVDQRPDVRAAEAQLHAATAGLGVAMSNRLPQFGLSAGYGGTSTRLGDLFSPANTFWSLAASVTQTVFDGGALRHRERAADAALTQAGALYRSAVLTAFQNVADVLSALQQDADAAQASGTAERASQDSLEIARRMQLLGATGAAPVLLAEQGLLQSRLAGVQARTNRLADTVALYQALGGGGWQARSSDQGQPPQH